jgi:hypothetical protein
MKNSVFSTLRTGNPKYIENGGVGISVFDIDDGYKFVKRFPPGKYLRQRRMSNYCCERQDGHRLCLDDRRISPQRSQREEALGQSLRSGCDRLAISPDGSLLYVPQFEGRCGMSSKPLTVMSSPASRPNQFAICSIEGTRAHLAGLKSPLLSVADTRPTRWRVRLVLLERDPPIHG